MSSRATTKSTSFTNTKSTSTHWSSEDSLVTSKPVSTRRSSDDSLVTGKPVSTRKSSDTSRMNWSSIRAAPAETQRPLKSKSGSSSANSSKYDIRAWVSEDDSSVGMLMLVPPHWKSDAKCRLTMIVELTKHLRYDVLEDLIDDDRSFGLNLPSGDYTPLQYVGYPSKSVARTATFEMLRETARVLVEKYRFRLFDGNELYKESIFGALFGSGNRLSKDVANSFYEYLTTSSPVEWQMPYFKSQLNKLTNDNVGYLHNKLLSCVCRSPELFAHAVFSQLTMSRVRTIEPLKFLQLVMKNFLTAPNGEDKEMDAYFSSIDVMDSISQFATAFIKHGSNWCQRMAARHEVGTEEHDELLTQCYLNYYASLGCIYTHGFLQSEILMQLSTQIAEPVRPVWLVKALAMFLVHANITLKTTIKSEVDFLLAYISGCYNGSSVKCKMEVERALGASAEIAAFGRRVRS